LSAFDEEQICAQPELALAGAWTAAALGHSQDAAVRLAAAERGDPEAPSVDGAATFGSDLLTLRALLGRRGVGALGQDAEVAYELERSVGGTLEATAACLAGVGRLLSARDVIGARTLLEEAAALGRKGRPAARAAALGLLSLVASQNDHWEEAAKVATAAVRIVEDDRLSNLSLVACTYAMLALVESHAGERGAARTHLDLVDRVLAGLAPFPWIGVLITIVMSRSALWLGDIKRAAALQREASRLAGKLPDAGLLADWIDELETKVGAGALGGPPLTPSEFRVLQKLSTFRPLDEIANELFVSKNTIKFHLKVIYRKLGVSSRAQAIERARRVGVVDRSEPKTAVYASSY
jgi:LuxR family maltose regulon positive regulatory protein